MEVLARANELERAGRHIVRMEIGEPDFTAPSLVVEAAARAGRPGLPHNALAQWLSLPHVNIEDLQPGDIVFFGNDFHHDGMYIGGGQMVHAPHTGDFVKVSSIYRSDLVGAARP